MRVPSSTPVMKAKDKFLGLDKKCWNCGYEWTLVFVVGDISGFRDSCPNCGEIL